MILENIQRMGLIESEINRLHTEYCDKVKPFNEEKDKIYEYIHDKFLSHPQWQMFIQRNGLNDFKSVPSDCLGYQTEKITLDFDFQKENCYIQIERWWRGEYDYCEFTRYFKISKLVEFLNNPNYYDGLIERAKRIKSACEENRKKKEKDEEYAKYLELKNKYDSV